MATWAKKFDDKMPKLGIYQVWVPVFFSENRQTDRHMKICGKMRRNTLRIVIHNQGRARAMRNLKPFSVFFFQLFFGPHELC